MRTRINNITFTPGTRSITTGIADLAIDDIRLFINESQMKVICSSMQKDNIDSIVSGVVTYKDTFPVLVSGDHITFEIDKGDNVAKESNATSNKNEIIAAIPTVNQIQSGLAKSSEIPSVADIQNGLAKESDLSSVASNVNDAKTAAQAAQASASIAASLASSASTYSLRLNQFFDIVGSVQGYEAIPIGEMLSELEEIMQSIDPDLTAAQAAAISDEATQTDISGTGRAIFAPSDVIVPDGYAKNVRDYKLYVEQDNMLG